MMLLDSVTFDEFELPDHIQHGGKHAVSVLRDIGGKRHVDAMGPDDDEIIFAGLLLGETAGDRSKQLQAIKDSGREVSLFWADEYRLGVVTDLQLVHEAPFYIRYHISFTVSSNPFRDFTSSLGLQSLSALVGADISSVQALLPNVGSSAVVSAVNAALGPVQAVADLDTADAITLSNLTPALGTAVGAITTGITAQETLINSPFNETTMPQFIASALEKGDAMDEQLRLVAIGNYVTRLTRNIINAAG